jgi:hypothetical protein
MQRPSATTEPEKPLIPKLHDCLVRGEKLAVNWHR